MFKDFQNRTGGGSTLSTQLKMRSMSNRDDPGQTGGKSGRGGNAADMTNGTGLKAKSIKLQKHDTVGALPSAPGGLRPRNGSMAKTFSLGRKK